MKEQALANAFAITMAVVYIICAAWTILNRASFMSFVGVWVHGVDLSALPYSQPTLSGLVVGLVTATVAAWISGYLFAWLYKKLAK